MKTLKNRPSRLTAEGGLCLAASYLCLLLSAWLPQTSLSLRLLAACLLSMAALRLDLAYAALVYLGTSILALLYPGVATALPYWLFFGPYPLFAFALQGRVRPQLALVLRLFVGTVLAAILIVSESVLGLFPLLDRWQAVWPYFLPLLILPVALLDYLLRLFTDHYLRHLAARWP